MEVSTTSSSSVSCFSSFVSPASSSSSCSSFSAASPPFFDPSSSGANGDSSLSTAGNNVNLQNNKSDLVHQGEGVSSSCSASVLVSNDFRLPSSLSAASACPPSGSLVPSSSSSSSSRIEINSSLNSSAGYVPSDAPSRDVAASSSPLSSVASSIALREPSSSSSVDIPSANPSSHSESTMHEGPLAASTGEAGALGSPGGGGKLRFSPPLFDVSSPESEWKANDPSGEWYCHSSLLWLYNSQSNAYFHTQTNQLFIENPLKKNTFITISQNNQSDNNEKNVSQEDTLNNRKTPEAATNDGGETESRKKRKSPSHEENTTYDDEENEKNEQDGKKRKERKLTKKYAEDEEKKEEGKENEKEKEREKETAEAETELLVEGEVGEEELNDFLLSIEKQMHMEKGGEVEGAAAEEEQEFELDLENDIRAATSVITGSLYSKTDCEDRHVSRESLPIEVVTSSCALCFYSAVFDGHAGSVCAEYAVNHLHKNILSVFRQSAENIRRKREKQKNRSRTRKGGKHAQVSEYSTEVEALVTACQKGFQITDNNYLDFAKRNKLLDGCTACVTLLYGPDEDGSLKLIVAHAGDSRAVLCRNDTAVRLTDDHKPNRLDERKRIERAGGSVLDINGVWRVMNVDKATKKAFGLSTSRSLGDILLKRPRELVVCTPEVNVFNIDFDEDLFIVLASDGVFDVMSDQEVVDTVMKHLHSSPQEAAEAVVRRAKAKGSEDDKTATVIFFGWRKDKFDQKEEEKKTETEEKKEKKKEGRRKAEKSEKTPTCNGGKDTNEVNEKEENELNVANEEVNEGNSRYNSHKEEEETDVEEKQEKVKQKKEKKKKEKEEEEEEEINEEVVEFSRGDAVAAGDDSPHLQQDNQSEENEDDDMFAANLEETFSENEGEKQASAHHPEVEVYTNSEEEDTTHTHKYSQTEEKRKKQDILDFEVLQNKKKTKKQEKESSEQQEKEKVKNELPKDLESGDEEE